MAVDFGDIALYTGIGIGALAFGLTEATGIANSMNEYRTAKQIYRDLPDGMKEGVGKPNKISFIAQGLWDGPKVMYGIFTNKEPKTALDRYVKPIDKEWLKLYAIHGLMNEAIENEK